MYSPVKDGVEKTVQSVRYVEAKAPSNLSGLVHCYWELKTENALLEDFQLHILPDACVNILFDQKNTEITAITALHLQSKTLNLGKEFHFVGIQLFPGAWQGKHNEILDDLVDQPYSGDLPLVETNKRLVAVEFDEKQLILSEFMENLLREKLVAVNPVIATILSNINAIKTVSDMAAAAGVSTRQLQRLLKRATRFSPHDFLKVIRLQQSFRDNYASHFADQSHFIHSFRKVTGYTPSRYGQKFDV